MLKENDLKILEKNSDSYVLIHKISAKKLVYKEVQLSSSLNFKYNQIFEELTIRNSIEHQNLLRLFSFYCEERNSLKSESDKIALIFEHWEKSFSNELNIRFQTQIHWTEQELLNTLEVLLWGLDALHSKGLVHGNITKNSIVFSYDGFVKLADQFIEGNELKNNLNNLIKMKNSHISPEILDSLNKEAEFPSKNNDIWQLGMIFMEAALLKPCLDLIQWDKKKINFNELVERIDQIEKIKSKNIARLLRIMLHPNKEERIKIMVVLKKDWPTRQSSPISKNKTSLPVMNIDLKEKIKQKKIDNIIYNKENSVEEPNIKEPYQYEEGNLSDKTRFPLQNVENYDPNNFKNDALGEVYLENIQNPNIFPKNYTLTLEGIIEETEENQEDKEKEEEKPTKTFFKNEKIQNKVGERLAEIQQLFEKSRARTNEILSKGQRLVQSSQKTSENQNELNYSAMSLLDNLIEKIEKKHLLSLVTYSNKDKFEGDISKNGEREGFGVYYKSNGQIFYQGEWKNNLFHGTGILNNLKVIFSKENLNYNDFNEINSCWLKYEGEFHLGKKHGNGVLLFSNKEFYQGNFKNDKIQGYGCFHSKNGAMVFGEWKDSILFKII